MYANETFESYSNRQRELEEHALALGGQRFRERLQSAIDQGSESQVGAAKKLLGRGIEPVQAALEAMIAEKKRGGQHAALKWVKLLGADVAAFLAVRVVLDNIHGRISVRKAAFEVTELMQDELRFRRFRTEAPKLFEYVMSSFTTSNYAHMARSLHARIHHASIDTSDLEMDPAERFTVGVKLLDVVRECTGWIAVESKSIRENGKNVDVVELVATEEALAGLDAANDLLECLLPVYLPMIAPPLPWSPGKRGGYMFAQRGKKPLVRSNSATHREMIEQAEMPAVYAAVNRIQETGWAINQRVLAVVEQLILAGGDVAGLPPSSAEALPEKPANMEDEEVSRVWRKAASKVYDRNAKSRVHRKALSDLLKIAKLMKDEAAFFYPHNVDFRGRVYPVASFLHPQGDDLAKGLLTFADGKELGRDGARWLALHGAASLGKTFKAHGARKLSHMTLDERVEYIESIEADIRAVAADPVGCSWWMDADDRWQFLAFCLDYAGYCEYREEGRGNQYVSTLPVAMDGTCNGLQHFAALWLDPVGGEAVNVTPGAQPHDIYQAVANNVLDQLEKDNAEQLAAVWLTSGLVDRKLTKRPTMTFGYGSQQFGFTNQLTEYVEGLDDYGTKWKAFFTADVVNEETGEVSAKSNLQPACAYMAKLIWNALQSVSQSAFEGMAWMRSAAKVIAKDGGKCVQWVVPGTGFPVRQGYMEQTQKQTRTVLAGTYFKPVVYSDTTAPNWKKQTSSVAPNIVHSLDAAALMLTVNVASDHGVSHFAMVHDSYGTHAGDAALLAAMTRQAFYGLYTQQDVVLDLWNQFSAQVDDVTTEEGEPVTIPAPPAKLGMDLGGVLVSDYFFS